MATEVKKPTANVDSSAVWSNEAQAYDTTTAGDETTYADSNMSGDFDPAIRFYSWQTKVETYTETILYVKWSCALAQDNDTWGIQYTDDGGNNWYDLLTEGNNSSASVVTEQVTLAANQDISLVEVKVVSNQTKGPDGHNVRIYDVWTEGEYTEVVEDLDVADPFDAVTVDEDVELVFGTVILGTPFDTISTLEDVDVEIPEVAQDLDVDEFEVVTVAENVEGLHGTVILDSAYEDVTIVEDVIAELGAQPDLAPDKFDTVVLVEDVDVVVTAQPDLDVSEFETVTLVEDIIAQLAHEFVLSLSDNFIDGAVTTYQLEAPATKDTGDFQAGKIHESSNPADAIDLDEDKYTEVEFCFKATIDAGEVSYDFRIEGLDTYTVTPQLTISSAGATLSVNVHDCADTETCLV